MPAPDQSKDDMCLTLTLQCWHPYDRKQTPYYINWCGCFHNHRTLDYHLHILFSCTCPLRHTSWLYERHMKHFETNSVHLDRHNGPLNSVEKYSQMPDSKLLPTAQQCRLSRLRVNWWCQLFDRCMSALHHSHRWGFQSQLLLLCNKMEIDLHPQL